jgi:hypothetical protein
VWPFYPVNAAFGFLEHVLDLRVPQWCTGGVRYEVLFRNISHVLAFCVLGKEMIEGLVTARPYVFWNGLIPFFRIVKFRIDVEDYASKGENPVAHHLAYLEFCMSYLRCHRHSV